MKRVAIYTNNKRLGRKLELILRPYAIVDVLGDGEPSDGYSLIFVDPESCPELIGCGISLPYTEKGGSIRALPFLHEDVISLVCSIDEKSRGKTLRLAEDARAALFGTDRIPLTEVEYKLLSVLLSSDGFQDRGSLTAAVWGEGADSGVLSVYVHYLREKLEASGERVIVTSRTQGYAIDKKYRR